MKRLLPFIILVSSLSSCERQPVETQKYDLFPLNVGNEYYYSYSYERGGPNGPDIDHKLGAKQWKITSSSSFNDTNIYVIEEITHYEMYILSWSGPPDTSYNWREADTVYFMLSEHLTSGDISFALLQLYGNLLSEISIQRYSDKPRVVIDYDKGPSTTISYRFGWHFASDSGLVKGSYYSFSANQGFRDYSFIMDSLKIIQ